MPGFNFIKVIEQFEYTSNRFNRDNVISGISSFFKNNQDSLDRFHKAYLKQDRDGIIKCLEQCVKSVKAGDDVKYRTYQAICYILRFCDDQFLNTINIHLEPPVSKLHRQEMLLRDTLDGAQHLEDLADKFCVDERSIRTDVKQLGSGQGLVQEYLTYLPDTGEKLGLNIDVKKDQVISLAKANPLKLLLTTKELLGMMMALSSYVESGGEFTTEVERVMGEIMRNAAGSMMDILDKVGLRANLVDLEDRINTLKSRFVLVDANKDFSWRRAKVEIEFLDGDKRVKMNGKVKEVENEHIVFICPEQKDKLIPIVDIIELSIKE